MKIFWFKKIIKGILLFILFASLFSYLVMLLWNLIIPVVTGWNTLTFWQAAGLLCLCKILFGFRGGWGRHWGGNPRTSFFMNKKWEDKMSTLTPEDKQRMKNLWNNKFCKSEFNTSIESNTNPSEKS